MQEVRVLSALTLVLVAAAVIASAAASKPIHEMFNLTIDDWTSIGLLAIALATTILAAMGLSIAARQIQTAREIEALNGYEKYHHLCLEYPDLACADFDHEGASAVDKQRYEVFVASMLLTIERIIVLFPRDKVWRAAFDDDIGRHAKFLGSDQFKRYRPTINPEVLELIDAFPQGRRP